MRLVECVPVGGHVYRVTTESEEYGRVTQTVFMFPPSSLPEDVPMSARDPFEPDPTEPCDDCECGRAGEPVPRWLAAVLLGLAGSISVAAALAFLWLFNGV